MKRLTFKRIMTFATLMMVLYTILRAALVWGTLSTYGINPWIFLFLDVITAPPYMWGIGKMIQGLRGVEPMKMVYIGGVVTLVTFLLPYIYLFMVGGESIPMVTKIIIGCIILVLFGAGPLREVIKRSQER